MASTLQTRVGRPVNSVFRRAEIKRRQESDGKFESSWLDISEFVKNYGTINTAIDDVRLNKFTHGGLTLSVRNDTGKFNPETSGNSLWNGFLTRYRTLLRVQAGYHDEDDNELPTTTTQGVFLMSEEIPISGDRNSAVLNCKSLVSLFDEELAVNVAGLGPTQTGSDIITKIRDHTDGSGNFVFREFITSTSWTIQSTTNQYNMATSTTLDGMTCWELMTKVAEAETFVILVNREGGIEFRNRDERSSVSTFLFYGQGFPEQNIIKLQEIKEPLDRLYNFFRLKYLQADTSTSYVESGTATVINPSNTSWKYGSRIYEFENLFFNTATAQAVVDAMFSTLSFSVAPQDVVVQCKFLPSVEVMDRVEVNYHSFSIEGTTLWDFFNWDEANWDSEFGENVNWDDKAFKVIGKTTNLDRMTTVLRLQEIV